MISTNSRIQPEEGSDDKIQINNNSNNNKEEEEFKDYPFRWVIMILFCLPNMMNAIEWITFSSISSQIQKAYDQSQFMVTMTSLVWMFLYIIINFPSNYILSEKGLRVGIFIGCLFTVIGAWIRIFINENFAWAILGQIFGGIGQPFILNAPAQIAAVWFKPKQRQLATAILSLINTIGVGIGFLFPSFFVDTTYSSQTRNQVYDLMICQAIVISACCIPTFIFFKDKPLTPPSHAANTEKTNFKQSMPALLKDKNFLYLYISFGCVLGNFNSIATLINFYLEQFSFTSDDSSYFGVVFIVSGLIGSAVMTTIVEKNHKYKKVMVITCFLSILSYALQMGLLELENFGLSIASFFIFGFFTTPLIPLGMEFACEITFPISETISSGLIFQSGQLFGLIQIIISAEGIVLDSQQNIYISQAIGLLFQIVGFVMYCLIDEDLKRKKEEHRLDNAKQFQQKELEIPQIETLIQQQQSVN